MSSRLGVLAVGLLTALLASCTNSPLPSPTSPPVDLVALRKRLALPDCPETDPKASAVAAGLPQTQLPCLGSDKLVNLAGLPRKPMLVNFWAQWCEPCRQEARYLREVSKARPDIGFIGINYQDPRPELALEFADLTGLRYPHIQDQERSLQASLGVPGIPMTLFVDASGKIVGRHIGVLTSSSQLTDLIERYLGKP